MQLRTDRLGLVPVIIEIQNQPGWKVTVNCISVQLKGAMAVAMPGGHSAWYFRSIKEARVF